MTNLARSHEQAPRKKRRDDFNRSPLLVFYEVTLVCDLIYVPCRAGSQSKTAGSQTPQLRCHRFNEVLSPPTGHTAMCGSTQPMCGAARGAERERRRCDLRLVHYFARMWSYPLGTQVAIAFSALRSSDDVKSSATPGLTHWKKQGHWS